MAQAKVALVTAASSGLGAAISRMLAVELGMDVIINYNSNQSRAEQLVQDIQAECTSLQRKNSVCAIRADTCDRAQVESLVQQAAQRSGNRLDVIISNVGWTRMRTFSDLEDNVDDEDWDRCFTANVKSHLWLFHATKKYLEQSNAREAGAAAFVSTASLAGVKPSGSSIAYAVTKSAQIHLARCLATISAPSIRVNSIAPGILLTEWGRSFPPERLQAALETNKLGRFATVDDVVTQVRTFVVSKSVTGQNAVIDAGYTL
ncbi:hypothetical protein NLU13_7310 [Sarocladium strictum]|uniref:Uncharacterized protein n=1 Tax=Sarocladium strictum TaxID=5046 RepID=A0AA39GCJ9_SARSR|nr:hypothetical protein NLU13_7310 [Sarocladium strictum]